MAALPLVLCLQVEEASPSNNTLRGMHYSAYKALRGHWRRQLEAALEASSWDGKTLAKCCVSIERYSAGGLDWDNAIGGLKPILDCIVLPGKSNPDGLGVILDDNPTAMIAPPYVQQLPAKKGQGRTVIKIYDAASLTQPPMPTWVST